MTAHDSRGAERGEVRRARALAQSLRPTGRSALRLEPGCRRRLAAALRAVNCPGSEGAAHILRQNGPRVLKHMEQMAGAARESLPACGGRARLARLMDALYRHGETPLEADILEAGLLAFDQVQPMTLAELWSVPEAVGLALLRGFTDVAEEIAGDAKDCGAAQRWLRHPSASLKDRGDGFFTHALRLAEERSDPEAQAILENALKVRGSLPEDVVRRCHDADAARQVRMENLLTGFVSLQMLDWSAAFPRISRVEQALRKDPSGIYPDMDEESRTEVRNRLSELAEATGKPELTVAQAALRCAGRPDARTPKDGVCWWLASDEGRKALLQACGWRDRGLPGMVPDPSGNRCAAALCLGALALSLVFSGITGTPWLWPACLPAAWYAWMTIVGRAFPWFFRPARLLKLELERVPAQWRTLVTLPVLLSGPERVEEACDRLEALGTVERDENILFLLLGDFADADAPHVEGDGAIVDLARRRIAQMNARAGQVRYAYLHRPRTLLAADRRWMGRDRKRGALMDLNRLLLGRQGAEAAFSVECGAASQLREGFPLVVTLDADTRLLPDDLRRLIGAMAHPMNRRYAVLQPAMTMLPSACVNGFVRLFAGEGGFSAYPASASNLWQDVTGTGLFAGKGIYRVREFYDALEGMLPTGRILSHDLIEGTLAGAGFAGDISFSDSHPATLDAALRREQRWTRGDWQLLPLLAERKLKLGFPARVRLADNLLRSLRAPALLFLILCGLWTGNSGAFVLGLSLCLLEPALRMGDGDRLKWRRAVAELSLLPTRAACMLDAILRTLWRLGVSGRHLLDWTTAADAEGRGNSAGILSTALSLLALPGLRVPDWTSAALGILLLFAVGPGWVRGMSATAFVDEERPGEEERAAFLQLARDTWRFFEENVHPESSPLPPDNVQLDPPVGVARRTSPTNIGLYLMSCLAACRLGFVDVPEMRCRMEAAVNALEGMEKWQGHIFNWIDLDTLLPLRPRYISSVDSGNLAAALLLCAGAREADDALTARMEALARNMDFSALYDEQRGLFIIGVEPDAGARSRGHYDLLASEARILSFTAILLGQVPARHWRQMGRMCAQTAGGPALLSWSGTMFEYLLPELILPAPRESLLGRSARAAIRAQRSFAQKRRRPWGVSESGCYAFDGQLNYQYQAFGLPALALSGSIGAGAVAPYASLLAAGIAPRAVMENLKRMRRPGWADEWGFIEAADYRHADTAGNPALVRSHMAHHQGMALCGLCEALTDHALSRTFMARPEAQGLAMLLEEQPPRHAPRKRRAPAIQDGERPDVRDSQWRMRPEQRLAETHLLAGGGATAVITADGAVHYFRGTMLGTRFSGDLLNRRDGACVHLWPEEGEDVILCESGRMLPGAAEFQGKTGPLKAELSLCLSPEDGTLVKRIRIQNTARVRVRCRVADVAPVALSETAAFRSHAGFQDLFVESESMDEGVLCFHRRERAPGERHPRLVHAGFGGAASVETDSDWLTGRLGGTAIPGGIRREFRGTVGSTLHPVSAIAMRLSLKPGEACQVVFVMNLLGAEEDAEAWLARWRDPALAQRSLRLALARAATELRHLRIGGGFSTLMRGAALLMDGRLAAQARDDAPGGAAAPVGQMWALGLSGDRPVWTVLADDAGQAEQVRAALRAHTFYRAMGVAIDLVLVNDGRAGYAQPVREMLSAVLDCSSLGAQRGVSGGAWLLDGAAMNAERRRALLRGSSMVFRADRDFYAQLRERLSVLEVPLARKAGMLPAGASTLPAEAWGNGFGDFDGCGGYVIDLWPGWVPPAHWCNILAGERGGTLLTDSGGSFLWRGNSREGRLTPFGGDGLRAPWGMMLWLRDPATGVRMRLLPGERPERPWRVRFDASSASYSFAAQRLSGCTRFCLAVDGAALLAEVTLENHTDKAMRLEVCMAVDWCMGTDLGDEVRAQAWTDGGACFATGAMPGVGILAAAGEEVSPCGGRCAALGRGGMMDPEDAPGASGGWGLRAQAHILPGKRGQARFAVAWAEDVPAAAAWAEAYQRDPEILREDAPEAPAITLQTPDDGLNECFNHWLLHQVRASRVLGRTGFYQPGGAWGFRDQLQDMLALIPEEPQRVRAHILRCAARQFEAGDVLHWWHDPAVGVRTRISDDALFLPYVTAAYVRQTGDAGILEERLPWLEDVPIPEGREEIYAEMRSGAVCATLHSHCMRAFFRAARFGDHGLARMGAGDWNDGMNRVGAAGKGESVWLSEFLAACAADYGAICPDVADRRKLESLTVRMRVALEQQAWDGKWYLRAYDDAGRPLGGAEGEVCRIDAISQAWAVLAGLDARRCASAMDAAWRMLADGRLGIIRLLTPPFGEEGADPGYIRGYPAGIRENGGQYTHGALWLLLAMIRQGDGRRAHRALRMLLPRNHARTPEEAARYRVEPYVMAADIYDSDQQGGRGGWTWYTGSAAWMRVCVLALMGYERWGDRVRLNALLGDWPEAALTLRCGESEYRLVCRRDADGVTLDGRRIDGEFIFLRDDGKRHEAFFPARAEGERS